MRIATPLAIVLLLCAAPAAAEVTEEQHRELERKVDVLTQEIETLRLGGAADTNLYAPRHGFAPAASKAYNVQQGVSVGGYGEMLYQGFDDKRQDDVEAGKISQLDMLRLILYVGYKFNDDLLFNSEVEVEHAGTGEEPLGGEVAVEFAYIDWATNPMIGMRAGMLLVPVGITNELHEPPVVLGARRPDVETLIIPTTWRANGGGIFGEFEAGVQYRAYVTEGLNAEEFTASSPVRGGRQKGSESKFTHPALTGRVDYVGLDGVVIGGSFFTGNSWQETSTDSVASLKPTTTIMEAHATVQRHGFDARALYAMGRQSDAAALSDELGLTGMDRLGEQFSGWYVEAAYDVFALMQPNSTFSLAPYVRYEDVDTQQDVPGGMENPANKSSVFTLGAAFKPHPNVVTKVDRQVRKNDAETATSQWNVQLGWMF